MAKVMKALETIESKTVGIGGEFQLCNGEMRIRRAFRKCADAKRRGRREEAV